jgi:hypothetical protein
VGKQLTPNKKLPRKFGTFLLRLVKIITVARALEVQTKNTFLENSSLSSPLKTIFKVTILSHKLPILTTKNRLKYNISTSILAQIATTLPNYVFFIVNY